jgi:type I restriction enzyme, S subunit
MASEWNEVTVTDIAAQVRNALVGGPFGSNLVSADYIAQGVPVIRGQNLGERWVSGDFAYVSDAKANSLSGNLASPGDIVFTQRGTLGQVSLVPDGKFDRYLVSQSQMKLTVNREIADPIFCYYQFCSDVQQDYIRLNAIQTGVPHTNLGILRRTPFLLPPLKEQRAIAHILGTLDDKIELNRKQNETLEAMARTLFKAWFVDFEPVRAKIEGRWQRGQSLPGLPAHLYDLFPDRLVESELGEIPDGWEIGSFSDAVEIIGGGTPKTSVSEYWNGDIPWFSVVDTPASSDVFVVQTEKSITQAGLNGSSTRLITRGTTIISARGTVGNLAIAGCDMTFNQSCYALQGKSGSGSCFVFLAAQRMVEQLKAMAHGSVFSTITRQTFEAVHAVLPPDRVLQQFEKSSASLLDPILGNVNESRSLAQLRDTLLPKLISGELRVPDAERILEA